jgi:hypothetical protein
MFVFPDLDSRTRAFMVEEISHDRLHGTLYISKRLTPVGAANYGQHLEDAARMGDELTLAAQLRQPGQLRELEPRGMGLARVPHNAAEVLAEGEFNRFYIRALCRRAIEDGVDELIVFRSKPVENPRPHSLAKVGSAVGPHRLLTDLRTHPGTDTALGLPPGPGSGLSVCLPSSGTFARGRPTSNGSYLP